MPPKDPSAIEIWRQEVSASLQSSSTPSLPTSSLSSHSTTTITPSHSSHTHRIPEQYLASSHPVSRPLSSSNDAMRDPRPPPVNSTSSFWRRLLSTTKNLRTTFPTSPVASSKSNTNSIVKTEMYSLSTDQDKPIGLLGRGQPQGEEGDTMNLPSEQSSALDGLRARAERLERARRLLDGEGSRKDEGRSKDVAVIGG